MLEWKIGKDSGAKGITCNLIQTERKMMAKEDGLE